MPTQTLTALPCNESWVTHNTLRCFAVVAVAETASQRLEGGPIVSRANPRGFCPAGSWSQELRNR